jgi:hypothetical protein
MEVVMKGRSSEGFNAFTSLTLWKDILVPSCARNRSHIAVYFCKTHTYIVLLNRQRIEIASNGKDTMPSFQAVNRASSSDFPSAMPRGRTLVLASSEALLSAFIFFYHRDPAALIDWTIAQ